MQAQDPRTPNNRTPSQTPGRVAATSSASKSANAAALSAALQGATLAFQAGSGQKPASDRKTDPISPGPGWLRVQSPNENGAVQAATRAASQASRTRGQSVSRSRSPTARQDVSRHGTGSSSVQELGSNNTDKERGSDRDLEPGFTYDTSPRPNLLPSGNNSSMLAPGGRPVTDRKHASFIAATLAASRSGTPSPNHTGHNPAQMPLTPTQLHARIPRRESHAADSRPTLSPSYEFPQLTDTSSIPPANSLISLFESKKDDMDPVKRSDPLPRQQRPSTYPKVHPPTPPRSRTPEPDVREKPKPKPKPKPAGIAENLAVGTEEGSERGRSVKNEEKADGQAGLLQVPTAVRKSTTTGQDDPRGGSQDSRKKSLSVASRSQSEGSDGHPRAPEPRAVALPTRGREAASVQPKTAPETSSGPPQLPPERRSTTKAKMTKPELKAGGENAQGTGPPNTSSDRDIKARRLSEVSNSSTDTFVSASSTQSPRAMSPVKDIDSGKVGRAGTHSLDRSAESRPTLPPRGSSANMSTPNLALDSLTSAIMAGNLASARLSSPSVAMSQSVPPPAPPPRRHGTHHRPHNPLHKLQKQLTGDRDSSSHSRHRGAGGKSPQRTGMLQTLRAPPTSKSDDEETRRHAERHRKRKLTGKGKHKHQEGSRKRWRDEITPRERRRYEAVWASNRGLFLRPGFAFVHPDVWRRRASPTSSGSQSQRSSVKWENAREVDDETAIQQQIEASRAQLGTPEADYVVNIVVRDIWSRSRLPLDELGEVWDLVDRKKAGVLDKQEFVVGMWLIDQRLKGRKIPAKVSESVWESARGIEMKVLPAPAVKGKESKRRDRSSSVT